MVCQGMCDINSQASTTTRASFLKTDFIRLACGELVGTAQLTAPRPANLRDNIPALAGLWRATFDHCQKLQHLRSDRFREAPNLQLQLLCFGHRINIPTRIRTATSRPLTPFGGVNLLELFFNHGIDCFPLTMEMTQRSVKIFPRYRADTGVVLRR